ncbi:MAG: ABC transporter ATP-binding protein/permease [Bifidobacteriaceae bacterium]|jgi:ABC-type transport system involved in cytochrome bd biosynthesis fused ATPase/permease subunit|nr:ABC transporter ATP-binding protein/permease [Bifidobacteriaceae bacterium]
MLETKILRLGHGSWRHIVAQPLVQWIGLAASATAILAIARFLAEISESAQPAASLGSLLGVAIPATLVRAAAGFAATRISFLAGGSVKRNLRSQLYAKLVDLGPTYVETVPTAGLLQLATEGVDQLEAYFGRYLPQLFYCLVAPITVFAILAPIATPVAVALLACAPLIPLLLVGANAMAKRVMKRQWSAYISLGDRFLESLQGMTTLKVYSADAQKQTEMDNEAERFRVSTMRVLRMQLGSIIFMDLVAFGGAALAIYLAASNYHNHGLALAAALSGILLAAEFFAPLRLLGSYFHLSLNGAAAAARLLAILELPSRPDGDKSLPPEPFAIQARSLSFSYGQTMVLQDVNFEIAAQGLTALVGDSGSGKSTIAALLAGRQSGYQGSIRFGSVELSDVTRNQLQKSVTLVTHDAVVFAGTVRDNLTLANPAASDEELATALDQVSLADLPGGLAAPVKERGTNLSSGQRQRLCLARALLRPSQLLILDEATANIDAESEAIIMSVVNTLAQQTAVLLISHRLANVVPAQCIYQLANGKIGQKGTHEQLLAEQGVYTEMWSKQCDLESYSMAGGRK